MLLEDQYGVGDVVDVGEASGTVEAVGLRITTIRDGRGVLWYIRNGEIVRVGNRSQGWALVVVDVPVGFAGVEEATAVLQRRRVEPGRRPGVRRRPARTAAGAGRGADHRGRRGGPYHRQDPVGGPVAGGPRPAPAADRGAGGRRHHRPDLGQPGLRPSAAPDGRPAAADRSPRSRRRRRPTSIPHDPIAHTRPPGQVDRDRSPVSNVGSPSGVADTRSVSYRPFGPPYA